MSERPVDVTVVYLARKQNGPEPVRSFVDSYRRFSAGSPHRLRIVAKGFDHSGELDEALTALPERPEVVCVPDAGVDIGAYLDTARTISTEFVFFLNTFSQIRVESWLALLLSAARGSRVGVVGVTGSYESTFSQSLAGLRSDLGPALRTPRRWPVIVHGLARYGSRFPLFPNPAIRTNAFLIRTALFRTLKLRGPDKLAALEFESGYRSMSRSLRRRGLTLLIAGANGRTYEADAWPESATFRFESQQNLIVHDNQTRGYQQADAAERERLGRLAWGLRYRG